jgi:Zn-dependent protease
MKFLMLLSFLPGFMVALTVHEAAHALVSKWLGDRYAEKQGRISLNPMRHLSVVGTLMLFVLGFGWGKPVPVNLYNYKRPKLYYLLSSLAGPVSNILLCVISIALMYGLNFVCQTEPGKTSLSAVEYAAYSLSQLFLYSLLYINMILAVINLIPIPPLDGSKIWPCLFPGMRAAFSGKATWIWIVILIIVMRGNALDKYLITPAIHFTDSLVPAMLHKQASQPSDSPAEMQAPDGTDEPNAVTAYFWLDQPYPAVHRQGRKDSCHKSTSQLAAIFARSKISTNPSPYPGAMSA